MTLTGHIVGTKGNTGRGIASIVENADYTITINLTDGTSYTTAPIAGFTAVDFDENYDLVVTKTDGTTETVETDIEAFRTVLAGYKSDAETAESNASGYATAASGSASTATAKAKEAESYAKGGTSSRTGEDTDNADYYRGLAAASATAAGTSESNAGTQALKSEGYAVGKQNGTDVSSGSDYYHNNAKHYSDLASTAETNAETAETNASTSATNANADALKAEGYAVGKQNGTTVISGTYYHNNAMYYNSQATNMASLATNKANSAGTDALKAEGFSVGEQNGTPVTSDSDYYENNAKYYAEQAETSAQSLVIEDALDEDSTNALENGVITKELNKKANIDGYYESLGSGTADQLSSNIFEEDSEPYNFRTSGGSIDIGDRETDMLVGGTIAWNQLVALGNDKSKTQNNVTFTDNRDGSYTVSTTSAGASAETYLTVASSPTDRGNHVVLMTGAPTGSTYNSYHMRDAWGGFGYDYGNGATGKFVAGGQYEIRIVVTSGTIITTPVTFRPQLFDITQMFGSAIANYFYDTLRLTSGASKAWFRKFFSKPIYEYNAGELMSVNTSAHKTVGFNQWDEEWRNGFYYIDTGAFVANASRVANKNPIKVVPNTTYFLNKWDKLFQILYLDADGNYTGLWGTTFSGSFTTPSNCYYINFCTQASSTYGATYNHDICINLSWDGERNGEYEEYVKHSYPLDSDLTLRGIPKLDASNNLYYDGDVYESDGTVTRKYGVVDLGTLTWRYNNDTGGHPYFGTSISNKASDIYNLLCSKYATYSSTTVLVDLPDKMIKGNTQGNSIYVRDYSYTDVATFKTAMSGVYLVYELATPTTETAEPYTNPQIVDDFGTEEYVDYAVSQGSRDVAIPVGHETQYMANLKAKLEMSPNSPEGAGDYIVRQTNGENEYVTLASNATIQNIIARLEALEGGGE